MRLKTRKQSMRQVRDAAAIERASAFVAAIGDIALAKARTESKEKPRYFRGAFIKPR